MNFYNYMIYRLYNWRVIKKDITPATTVELILCITHYAHIFTLYILTLAIFPEAKKINFKPWQLLIFAFGFQFIYHILIYNKERWNKFVEIYSKESDEQKTKRTRYLLVYIFGSIFLQFISLPLLSCI